MQRYLGRRKCGVGEATNWRTAGGQGVIPGSRSTNNRGRVAAASISQHSPGDLRNSVSNGKIQIVVRLGEVNAVKGVKDRARIIPTYVCKCACPQGVENRNCKQCGFHPVTGNV